MTESNKQKIAVPLAGEQFSMHFGQSTAFAVFEVDAPQRKILNRVVVPLGDQHACGMVGWLQQQGVQSVIVGGLGRGALANLVAAQVAVYAGIPGAAPEALVQACLEGRLPSAIASCAGHGHDHGHHHEHGQEGACHGHAQPAAEKTKD